MRSLQCSSSKTLFQHTATRRWLLEQQTHDVARIRVSTHSHPKVAALPRAKTFALIGFNTQPPEGGCNTLIQYGKITVSFNTQPPEGGCFFPFGICTNKFLFQHTATRRWLPAMREGKGFNQWFQHTATRRWLHFITDWRNHFYCFNTQPPEGGCYP